MHEHTIKHLEPKILDIISNEVDNFKDLSFEYINQNYKFGKSDLLIHFCDKQFQIFGNEKLYHERHLVKVRTNQLATLYYEAYNKYPDLMSNMNLLMPVCLSDSIEYQYQDIPALVFCKKSYSNHILIPSINNFAGHIEVEQVNLIDQPLHTKLNKMCFAGSLTGRMDDVKNNQRVKIADLSSKNPDKYFCKLFLPF